jgi:hypothetical protein
MDKEKNEEIRSIIRHTIGEEMPVYDIKHILWKLRLLYIKDNQAEAATVLKTE